MLFCTDAHWPWQTAQPYALSPLLTNTDTHVPLARGQAEGPDGSSGHTRRSAGDLRCLWFMATPGGLEAPTPPACPPARLQLAVHVDSFYLETSSVSWSVKAITTQINCFFSEELNLIN